VIVCLKSVANFKVLILTDCVAGNAQPSPTVGNSSNDGPEKETDGIRNHCSYQPLLLLIWDLDATLFEGEDTSPLISQGDNSTAPGSGSGVHDHALPGTSDNCSYQGLPLLICYVETPRTDIGDNSTAPNSEFDDYNPLLPGTSNNCSYQGLHLLIDCLGTPRTGYEDDSIAPNSNSEVQDFPLPSTSNNFSYQRLRLLKKTV